MKILVIGGSGFIGTRLVSELLRMNHQVIIFDIKISEVYPQLTVVGDVRLTKQITDASTGIDVIYNLAAEHRDDVSPASLYYDVNVSGAKNIVQAAEANNVRQIIFTSTVAIYGLNKINPDETFPAEPFNEYGRTKWKAEKIFLEWAESNRNRNLGIVRPAVIFGEGNRGNVYNLISQIESGRFIMIGNGNNHKSMGYVENIAQFLAELLKLKNIQIYNFCDKPDLSSYEITEVISKNLGKTIPKIKLPLWLGLTAGHILDIISKITGKKFPISAVRIRKFASETSISTERLKKLGFKPKYNCTEGIVKMINNDFKRS